MNSKLFLLTAYTDLPRRLHRRAVTVVRVTRHLVHVPRDVVDDRDHVSGSLLSDQPPGNVQRYGGRRCAHGDAQHRHTAALHHQIYRMNGRWLFSEAEGKQKMVLFLDTTTITWAFGKSFFDSERSLERVSRTITLVILNSVFSHTLFYSSLIQK